MINRKIILIAAVTLITAARPGHIDAWAAGQGEERIQTATQPGWNQGEAGWYWQEADPSPRLAYRQSKNLLHR